MDKSCHPPTRSSRVLLDARSAGLLYAAFRVVLFLQGFAVVGQAAALARYARIRSGADDARRELRTLAHRAAIPLFAICALLAVSARPLTELLYSAAYIRTAPLLAGLVLLIPLELYGSVLTSAAAGLGNAVGQAISYIWALAIFLIAAVCLINLIGSPGAVLARAAAQITLLVGGTWAANVTLTKTTLVALGTCAIASMIAVLT